jgi:hypothetical protein
MMMILGVVKIKMRIEKLKKDRRMRNMIMLRRDYGSNEGRNNRSLEG